MDKKKPIGYGKKDRDEMKALIERTEPKSGDYVGSGTVTEVPKKKKMKRMADGGMAGSNPYIPTGYDPSKGQQFTVPSGGGPAADPYGKGSERPGMKPPFPGRGMDKPVNPGMLNKYQQMKGRFPSFSWGNTAPTTRGDFRSLMDRFRDYRGEQNDAERAARMAGKIGNRYNKISSRFPGYKPTTEGPVDTKDELRTYMRGLGDYRRANPDIRPAKPQRPAPDVTTQTKRGGGLARKGVGQALARGGLVKANGCATRGKTKGKIV